MNIRALLLPIVAISSAAAQEVAANPVLSGAFKSMVFQGDTGTVNSQNNAHLRGYFSAEVAEGVSLETDSYGGDGGEEGRFEAATPEFLSCTYNGQSCMIGSECCSGKCMEETCCVANKQSCMIGSECCSGNCGRTSLYYSGTTWNVCCKAIGQQCGNTNACCWNSGAARAVSCVEANDNSGNKYCKAD